MAQRLPRRGAQLDVAVENGENDCVKDTGTVPFIEQNKCEAAGHGKRLEANSCTALILLLSVV